jgi:hypothetical protein
MNVNRQARPTSLAMASLFGVGLVFVALSSAPGAGRTQADGESQADSSANASEADATLTLTMTVEGQERQVVAKRVLESRTIGYQFFEADSGMSFFAKPNADVVQPVADPDKPSAVLKLMRVGKDVREEILDTNRLLDLIEVRVCDRVVFAGPNSTPEVPLSLIRVGDFYQRYCAGTKSDAYPNLRLQPVCG